MWKPYERGDQVLRRQGRALTRLRERSGHSAIRYGGEYSISLEKPTNFVAPCGLTRFVGIDHCWIEATQ